MMTRRTLLQMLAAARTPQPNIVILLADDLGYGDVGFTGCPDIRTPNIDNLASGGVHFTHAYSNGAVCSPTRAALLTGQYQQRNGMDKVIYVDERDIGLPLEALLIPEVLKTAGYATGLFGKWHLGIPKKYFPTRQGFDEFIGFVAGNIDYFSHKDRLGNADLWNREEPLSDPRYMTQLVGDESIRFIDRHAKGPFFLYSAFNAPHDPYQGPGDPQRNRSRTVYRAMVEALDEHIGRILAHLKQRGLEENTVVFFMSDNGGVPGMGRNAPFRGAKGSLFEGGIRTPLLARWKGRFPAGAKTSEMVAGMDLFPTCVSLAGAKLPPGHKLDGVDLLDVCQGRGKLKRDTLYFHYQAPKEPAQHAMMSQGWKYLSDAKQDEFLFHLSEDRSETKNLATAQPERLARMKRQYEAWRKDVFTPHR
jgi:arylsulfatase A-like enzyme